MADDEGDEIVVGGDVIEPDDEERDEDEESEEDEPTFTAKDRKAMQDALHKERTQRREAERRLRDLEAPADKSKEDDPEVKFKVKLVNVAARAAFKEAGIDGDFKLLSRMLDTDSLDVNDDGEVEGLDDQIETIKTLFEAREEAPVRKIRPDAGRRRFDGAGGDAAPRKKTATELQVEGLLGKRTV